MGKRILIVDDEKDIAMLIHHWLEQRQFEIEEAHSGSEALKRIFRGGIDLVLMDYEMKDIKGDRLCLMIREDNNMRKLPVIIVTGHMEIDDQVFKEYGANEVVYKPVNADELVEKIEHCLK